MSKADEVRARVRACSEWIAQGWTHRQIEEHATSGKAAWTGRGNGPISLSQVQTYIARAQAEIDELALPHRRAWLRRIVARAETVYRKALQADDYREAVAVLKLLVTLTGAKQAAEEEQEPSPWEKLAAMLVRVDDLDLGQFAAPAAPAHDPAVDSLAELKARRLIYLLEQADDGTAAFRALGPPPKEEIAGRLWVTGVNRESLWQRLISPGVTPEKRAEAVYRHGGTAGMLSPQAELAELLQRIRGLAGLDGTRKSE